MITNIKMVTIITIMAMITITHTLSGRIFKLISSLHRGKWKNTVWFVCICTQTYLDEIFPKPTVCFAYSLLSLEKIGLEKPPKGCVVLVKYTVRDDDVVDEDDYDDYDDDEDYGDEAYGDDVDDCDDDNVLTPARFPESHPFVTKQG